MTHRLQAPELGLRRIAIVPLVSALALRRLICARCPLLTGSRHRGQGIRWTYRGWGGRLSTRSGHWIPKPGRCLDLVTEEGHLGLSSRARPCLFSARFANQRIAETQGPLTAPHGLANPLSRCRGVTDLRPEELAGVLRCT